MDRHLTELKRCGIGDCHLTANACQRCTGAVTAKGGPYLPQDTERGKSVAMPMGRPSKYDPAFCEAIIAAGEEGQTLAEMAATIGVDRSTLKDWTDQHPDFSRAVKIGLDRAQAWWERQGRVATFGGCDGFNATSYIFQMKNRFKEDWRDKVEQERTGEQTHIHEVRRVIVDGKDA